MFLVECSAFYGFGKLLMGDAVDRMVAFFRRTLSRTRRFWRVFFGEAWFFWVGVVLPVLPWYFLPFVWECCESIQLYGAVIEIGGVFIVGYQIIAVRQHFESPSIREQLAAWWSRLSSVTGSISTEEAIGIGVVKSPNFDSLGRAEQIRWLKAQFERLDHHVPAARAEVRKALKGIAELEGQLEKVSVGNFGMEFVGVFLVVWGIFFANLEGLACGLRGFFV